MKSRLATIQDLSTLYKLVKSANLSYITFDQIKDDVKNHRLVVVTYSEFVCGFCAIINEPSYGFTAIKRLYIGEAFRMGGMAKSLIRAATIFASYSNINTRGVGATPGENNLEAISLFKTLGFSFQYAFNYKGENLHFYLKKIY